MHPHGAQCAPAAATAAAAPLLVTATDSTGQ